MIQEWQELTNLTKDMPLVVERVKLTEKGISLEGEFELPPLARLSTEDQIFVAAFVRCHGSIKQMEQYFGVSYPTIKNRLNRIGELLEFVKIDLAPASNPVLDRLERGEISVDEAMELLRKGDDHE
ncbi:MAG: DUF2089 domain-containing protein [candidate division Zixibacteria bacterium]|nr:DUF2089 domain-containing protein [candidate division Zixibacteria bacterium]